MPSLLWAKNTSPTILLLSVPVFIATQNLTNTVALTGLLSVGVMVMASTLGLNLHWWYVWRLREDGLVQGCLWNYWTGYDLRRLHHSSVMEHTYTGDSLLVLCHAMAHVHRRLHDSVMLCCSTPTWNTGTLILNPKIVNQKKTCFL